MKLTDDDYRSLAEQCADKDWGRIDHNGESVTVDMNIHVEYDPLEEELSGGHIPTAVECYVSNVESDTDVDVDTARIEEETYKLLMQY